MCLPVVGLVARRAQPGQRCQAHLEKHQGPGRKAWPALPARQEAPASAGPSTAKVASWFGNCSAQARMEPRSLQNLKRAARCPSQAWMLNTALIRVARVESNSRMRVSKTKIMQTVQTEPLNLPCVNVCPPGPPLPVNVRCANVLAPLLCCASPKAMEDTYSADVLGLPWLLSLGCILGVGTSPSETKSAV